MIKLNSNIIVEKNNFFHGQKKSTNDLNKKIKSAINTPKNSMQTKIKSPKKIMK
jgi:hypothetical protein